MEQFVQIDLPTPDGTEGRLILAEPSVMALGRWNHFLGLAQDAITERYGPPPEKKEDGDDKLTVYDERLTAALFVPRWADVMACLHHYEVLNGDGSYHEAPFPYADPLYFCEELRYSKQREVWDAAGRYMGPILGRLSIDTDGQKKESPATTVWLTSLQKRS